MRSRRKERLMDLSQCADCAPSHITVVLLVFGALIALMIARRARWSVIVTMPLLLSALELFAGQGYSHTPALGLTSVVLGLPVLGLIRRRPAVDVP
jgi:hypothetical protein